MNQAKIVVEKIVDTCSDCPFHYKEIYDDSFEAFSDVTFVCRHEGTYIINEHKHYIINEHKHILDKVNIPIWCPLIIKNEKDNKKD